MSIQDHAEKEMQMYKETPPTFTSDDPAAWWWNQLCGGTRLIL